MGSGFNFSITAHPVLSSWVSTAASFSLSLDRVFAVLALFFQILDLFIQQLVGVINEWQLAFGAGALLGMYEGVVAVWIGRILTTP